MQRVFWTTCPHCDHKLMVDYEIRFSGAHLECPGCRGKYTVEQAKTLDERW